MFIVGGLVEAPPGHRPVDLPGGTGLGDEQGTVEFLKMCFATLVALSENIV